MDSQVPPNGLTEPSFNAPPVQPPKQPSAFVSIFVGPRGLRAGWKYLIFTVLLFLLIAILGTPAVLIIGKPQPHHVPALKLQFANELDCAVSVLLATWILAKWLDKKPFGYFGLPGRRAFRSEFWIGAAIGFGALFVQLCVMKAGGWFEFGAVSLRGIDIVRYGVFWGIFFLCTGFFEEGMLRGYPQRVVTNGFGFLKGGWGFWTAALIFSTIFACLHLGNPGENKFGIFMVFVDGMVMCFSLWRTGSMWFAVGNHAAWDWGQTFFFGTPDSGMKPHGALFSPAFHGPMLLSGGADGPEGSVLVLLSELLIAVMIAVIYRGRRYPLLADETPEEPLAPAAMPVGEPPLVSE